MPRARGESVSSGGSNKRPRHALPAWRRKFGTFVEHRWVTVVMTVFTVYALFGDDIRLALFKPSADDVFFGLSSIALFLFTTELILQSIGKQDYVLGFYFWLDLLATASLIPDIGWIWDEIVSSDDGTDATGAVRAGRASRAGTRAGRIVRIVRLVRLIRIAKLYKHVQGDAAGKLEDKLEGEEHEDHLGFPDEEAPELPAEPEPVDEPSAVGKHLSDLTTRRVILLVLAMIILIPVFDINTFVGEEDETEIYALESVHRSYFNAGQDTTDPFFQSQVALLAGAGDLMHLTVNDIDMDSILRTITGVDISELRTTEKIKKDFRTNEALLVVSTDASYCLDASANRVGAQGDCQSFAYFNNKSNTILESGLNIGKTLFVMVVLAAGAVLFTRDAERIVIGPIERMVSIVKKLSEDPLAAIKGQQKDDHEDKNAEHGYETMLLEKTLAKISGLLQIGFGEAGSEIISQNLKSGALNPLLDGKMMTAVFGFCDIRQFTDTTECLQAQVMGFVNQVGGLVHFACSQYSGSVNKNIGDAFLLVWRLDDPVPAIQAKPPSTPVADGQPMSYSPVPGGAAGRKPPRFKSPLRQLKEEAGVGQESKSGPSGAGAGASSLYIETDEEKHYSNPMHQSAAPSTPISRRSSSRRSLSSGRGINRTTFVSDSALFAFLKMIVDIENSNRSGMLRQWQDHPAVRRRFKSKFWVKMGYGLHTGWAVEGAIGSRYKIDASYLSPNVNMASRLEAATKQFRTPLLVSHEFYKNLSPEAKSMCRVIDCVMVKGSVEPIKLYTADVTHIPAKLGIYEIDLDSDAAIPGAYSVNFSDPRVKSLQKDLHPEFYPTFNRAMDAYFAGDFTACRIALEEGLKLKPEDGPTQTLMEVLASFNYMAPSSWKGARALTEK